MVLPISGANFWAKALRERFISIRIYSNPGVFYPDMVSISFRSGCFYFQQYCYPLGKMSPYPVVVMVVNAKYMLVRYREKACLLFGQSPETSFSEQ